MSGCRGVLASTLRVGATETLRIHDTSPLARLGVACRARDRPPMICPRNDYQSFGGRA